MRAMLCLGMCVILLSACGVSETENQTEDSQESTPSTIINEEKSDAINGWTQYKNSNYFISFQYPSDWELSEKKSSSRTDLGQVNHWFSLVNDVDFGEDHPFDTPESAIVLSGTIYPTEQDFDAWLENRLNKGFSLTSESQQKREIIEIDGVKITTQLVTNAVTGGGLGRTIQMYFFQMPGGFYEFLGSTPSGESDTERLKTVDQIIRSIRFSK